ncbi:MAG TPA: hypothetical protein VE974_00665 [Thermoanaerobaculia bacterium]|nr:hypothetical protein [Thermoanaerobaculia bacterium]
MTVMTMTTTRLSAEQIERTSNYLENVRDRYATPVVRVQSLFGRCCLATLAPEPAWSALAEEAATLANDLARLAPQGNPDLDPLALIEIHRMMKREGREVAPLRELLAKIGPELEKQPSEVRSIGRVRVIASLLSELGFPAKPVKASKDAANLLDEEESWITAPVPRLSDLADHLVANRVRLDEPQSRILALIALGELRNYRLDLGCKLLRAVMQWGIPCDEARDGVDFIALQRRRDGRYGFVDRLSEKSGAAADPELTLHLPLTLNAVWLFMIEAVGGTA